MTIFTSHFNQNILGVYTWIKCLFSSRIFCRLKMVKLLSTKPTVVPKIYSDFFLSVSLTQSLPFALFLLPHPFIASSCPTQSESVPCGLSVCLSLRQTVCTYLINELHFKSVVCAFLSILHSSAPYLQPNNCIWILLKCVNHCFALPLPESFVSQTQTGTSLIWASARTN